MHNSCGEIFSGFCRNLVRISESIWTTCFEINDLKGILFQFFRDQADSDKGREGGGMAKAGGQKEEEKGRSD